MDLEALTFTLVGWNIFGLIILAACQNCQLHEPGALGQAKGWEFVNPLHVYKHNHVNWFGAIVVALWYNLLCPVAALCYWFYKLCTVGGR